MVRIEKRLADGFAGLFAADRIRAGEDVMPITGIVENEPSRYSLQLSENAHIVPPSQALEAGAEAENYLWCFTNHGCRPNLRVDTARRVFVALCDLDPGDELLFDYNTTEWSMATPFACRCGAPGCYGVVAGYRHLGAEGQARLAGLAAPHLLARCREMAPVE